MKLKLIIQVSLLLGYGASILADSWLFSSILAPLNATYATVLLVIAAYRSDHTNRLNRVFAYYAVAFFFWTLAETIWFVRELLGMTPDPSFVYVIYLMTNLFIVGAITRFGIIYFSKWNMIMFAIDTATLTIFSAVMLWFAYFHGNALMYGAVKEADPISLVSIFSDIFMMLGVLLYFLLVRMRDITLFLKIISLSIIGFGFSDMLYYYTYFLGLYLPNQINDFLYIFFINGIALGAILRIEIKPDQAGATLKIAQERYNKWYYLFLFPIGGMVAKLSGIIGVSMGWGSFTGLILLVFLYRFIGKYVSMNIENARLLKLEIEYSQKLEQRVNEQVCEITFLADKDPLTSLYNRRFFFQSLDEMFRESRVGETVALALVNVDRFKTYNTSFGHEGGDYILTELAARFTARNCKGALIARIGGDEFAVVFNGRLTPKDIEGCCEDILKMCNEPVVLKGQALTLTVSIGVAMKSEVTYDAQTIVRHADVAMYFAKAQGYNRYQFFDPILIQSVSQGSEVEIMLRHMDYDSEFEVFYQPQFDAETKTLLGAEALLRWNNPQHGYIPPDVFIPIAEETGDIIEIGKWVTRKSLQQAALWNRDRSEPPVKISFNLSPRQLKDEEWLEFLENEVNAWAVNPEWIGIEITERVMLSEESLVRMLFDRTKEMGIAVSVDDFGSGYSSLGYLDKYPFDRIKIDKSLIDNLSKQNRSGVNIVKAVIAMAEGIGVKTVAEGVETKMQLDLLKELGCDQIQGYLFGRPVPPSDFEQEYLQKNE